jgi:hypothetical protein
MNITNQLDEGKKKKRNQAKPACNAPHVRLGRLRYSIMN